MAIVFVLRGMCNAYNEGAEKGELNMNKKIIKNTVVSIIIETILAMLLIVGILILIAEDQIATAIMAGVGLMAAIGAIINEFSILNTRLEMFEKEVIENYLKN